MRILFARFLEASANFVRQYQNRRRLGSYLVTSFSQEIVMPSATIGLVRCIGAASYIVAACWAGSAFASQGPGTSAGTARHFTQLAMAVLIYGIAALVVGAGLFGALRRR